MINDRASKMSLVLSILFVIALGIAFYSVATKDTQPTPQTPQTPVLSTSSAIVGTCALIVYEDTTAYTIEGEPTFNLAQGTHIATDGLTVDLAFYRIHENDRTAYVHVTTVVPRDAACLEQLQMITDILPSMFDTP